MSERSARGRITSASFSERHRALGDQGIAVDQNRSRKAFEAVVQSIVAMEEAEVVSMATSAT
jgi:hypothetical protein